MTSTGLSAYVNDLLGVVTTGADLSEIKKNITEALEFFYEDEPKKVQLSLSIKVDFKQFFRHYNFLNQKTLASKIGMDNTLMSQYIRGVKTPSEKQLNRISSGIKKVGRELAELQF